MSDYSISILRKEIRQRVASNAERAPGGRCSQVWEGERCIMAGGHSGACVIGPPSSPTGSTGDRDG